jgi:hypothetical protein
MSATLHHFYYQKICGCKSEVNSERTSYFSMRWWLYLLCTRPTHWVFVVHVPAQWLSTSWEDISLQPDTLSWFRDNQCLILHLKCCVLSRKADNINYIGFRSTWPGTKPTIYRTWDEHVNNYISDMVILNMKLLFDPISFWE